MTHPVHVLTDREQAVMALFSTDDFVDEERIGDECYPLILRPRLVVNSLCRKGRVRLGEFEKYGDGRGYEVIPTPRAEEQR